MKRLILGLLLLVACGEPKETAPTPPPAAPTPPPRQEAEICPLRLSQLQDRMLPGTTLYIHNPKTDPQGSLDTQSPQPIRDIFPAAGTYHLRFVRTGYENLELTLELRPDGTTPSLDSLPLDFKPLPALADSYREAEEALTARDGPRARAALDRVRALDDRYRETPTLITRLQVLEEELERRRLALLQAEEALRNGDLAPAASLEELKEKVAAVQQTQGLFEQAVLRLDVPAAEAALTSLRETLTPADPRNRDRQSQIDDLNALIALIRTWEQICLDPAGTRERLLDLFDKSASKRAEQLATEMRQFRRHASYVSIEHTPEQIRFRDNGVEITAALAAVYATAAGESKVNTRVEFRFMKSESWKLTDCTEAPQ